MSTPGPWLGISTPDWLIKSDTPQWGRGYDLRDGGSAEANT
jgi:hypothetical protein